MSCTARHGIARSFSHRRCTLVGHTVFFFGMAPALFGGGANVAALALATFAGLGLLMVVNARGAARHTRKGRIRPVRAALTLATDALALIVAAGLVIDTQLGGGSGSVLFPSDGLTTMADFLALCTVHHFAHRRSRRRSRRY